MKTKHTGCPCCRNAASHVTAQQRTLREARVLKSEGDCGRLHAPLQALYTFGCKIGWLSSQAACSEHLTQKVRHIAPAPFQYPLHSQPQDGTDCMKQHRAMPAWGNLSRVMHAATAICRGLQCPRAASLMQATRSLIIMYRKGLQAVCRLPPCFMHCRAAGPASFETQVCMHSHDSSAWRGKGSPPAHSQLLVRQSGTLRDASLTAMQAIRPDLMQSAGQPQACRHAAHLHCGDLIGVRLCLLTSLLWRREYGYGDVVAADGEQLFDWKHVLPAR